MAYNVMSCASSTIARMTYRGDSGRFLRIRKQAARPLEESVKAPFGVASNHGDNFTANTIILAG